MTVWGPPEHGHDLPIITMAVAIDPRCGRELWAELHKEPSSSLATSPAEPPKTPWLAARLDVGGALHRETMDWLGDFERCLAWAWIEN